MMYIQYIIRHYDVYTVHYQTLWCLYSTLSDTHYDVYTVHYQTLWCLYSTLSDTM